MKIAIPHYSPRGLDPLCHNILPILLMGCPHYRRSRADIVNVDLLRPVG